jgi:hypothetical protein
MFIQILPGGQFQNLSLITIAQLVSSFVIILMIVTSILFVFTLMIGGIRWIASAGNRENLERAKNQIVNALIGLLIVFSAWAILNFLSAFFSIDLFSFEIPSANP